MIISVVLTAPSTTLSTSAPVDSYLLSFVSILFQLSTFVLIRSVRRSVMMTVAMMDQILHLLNL